MTDPAYRTIEDENRAAELAAEQARLADVNDYSRLVRLSENEDVRWLIDTHLAPIVARELKASHTLSHGKERCWEHLQRHEVVEEAVGLLARELARLEQKTLIRK
jgi:hypothetical protein